MRSTAGFLVLAAAFAAGGQGHAASAGDPDEGARLVRPCLACHTLEPGEHRTGPSLAGIFGRRAGTVPGFTRYSPALEAADITWTKPTLDDWLTDPEALVPGNRMTFPGMPDAQARADLIAYLELAAAPDADAPEQAEHGGMMGAREMADLRHDIGPNNRITGIGYCGDTYTVEMETGEAHDFWEFNLRFKTDSSQRGPQRGHPVLIPGGMMGDRAFAVFAAPEEISPFIKVRC